MTVSERCRDIARRLDAGDASMCGLEAEGAFISEHGELIWSLRAAQQAKAKARMMQAGSDNPYAPSDPEPMDRDELDDEEGECQCECEECQAGNCQDCSDSECTDPFCVHDPERDGDEEGEQTDADEDEL